jgi:hypothetical protein
MTIPQVRPSRGNAVLEFAEQLMNAGFQAGYGECERIHESPSNICHVMLRGKSEEASQGRNVRISAQEIGKFGDCTSVVTVCNSELSVVPRSGERCVFPADRAWECILFAIEQ